MSKTPCLQCCPSSGLAANFALMEKAKITQSFRQWLTSKNRQTSFCCNTDPKTLAQLGEG
ncbi:MAG: hypothetical protein VXY74_05595 [SAR324 cluster bacterium]|nr:hypothetical protein [SAR324 cluster bacterium]